MRRNFGNNRNDNMGPLMTNHLQMVQDLDMELQLLKRKRQMIEEQQRLSGNQMMNRQRNFDYNPQPFGQQPYYQSVNLQTNSASNFYDRNETFRNNYGQNDWRGPPNKRFAGAPKNKPKKFQGPGQRNQNFNNQQKNFGGNQKPQSPAKRPTPLMAATPKVSLAQKMQGPKTGPGRKDFRPTKVTKPNKFSPQMNKLKSYPIEKRSELVKVAASMSTQNNKSLVLRSDTVPTQQMTGRLELALGNISKEVKQRFEKDQSNQGINFNSPVLQRALKQAIRERLRSVMLGKVVGNVANICQFYRDKYPVETDNEIVEVAVEAYKADKDKRSSMNFLDTDDPEKYIRINMSRLLDRTLKDMFAKLKEIYQAEDSKLEDIIDLDKEGNAEKPAETKEPAENTEHENAENGETKPSDAAEETPINNDEAKTDAPNENGKEEAKPDAEPKDAPQKEENEALTAARAEKAKYYDRIVEEILKHKLPNVLPQYKDVIVKMVDYNKMYRTSKASIINKAREKADAALMTAKEALAKINAGITSAEVIDVDAPENEKTPPRPLLHMVKIWGRPSLPKRKLMQAFLNDFHPMSIKKHKQIHNLLFVGFANKDDYDKILAAHETVVGHATLIIKVSEKINPKSEESLNETTEENTDKLDDISALDTQIDDLLASIRKSEEEEKTDNKNDENAEALTTNDDNAEAENQNNGNLEAENKKEETAATDSSGMDKAEDAKPMEVIAEEAESDAPKNNEKVEELKNDAKESGKATPTRSSSRVAASTPSTIRTRRASRLAQNN